MKTVGWGGMMILFLNILAQAVDWQATTFNHLNACAKIFEHKMRLSLTITKVCSLQNTFLVDLCRFVKIKGNPRVRLSLRLRSSMEI